MWILTVKYCLSCRWAKLWGLRCGQRRINRGCRGWPLSCFPGSPHEREPCSQVRLINLQWVECICWSNLQFNFCGFLVYAHLSSCRLLVHGRGFTLRASNYKAQFPRDTPSLQSQTRSSKWYTVKHLCLAGTLQATQDGSGYWNCGCCPAKRWRLLLSAVWLDGRESLLVLGSAQQPNSLAGVILWTGWEHSEGMARRQYAQDDFIAFIRRAQYHQVNVT